MKRIGILVAVACAVAGVALTAEAQAAANCYTTPCVFTAVDAVMVQTYRMTVTGILEGQATPSLAQVDFGASTTNIDTLAACERLALLAMTRPGGYQFRVQVISSSTASCRLTRVTP